MKKIISIVLCTVFLFTGATIGLAEETPVKPELPENISTLITEYRDITEECIRVKYEILEGRSDLQRQMVSTRLKFLNFRISILPGIQEERMGFMEMKAQYLQSHQVLLGEIRDAIRNKDREQLQALRVQQDELKTLFEEGKVAYRQKRDEFKQQLEDAATDIRALQALNEEQREAVTEELVRIKELNTLLQESHLQTKQAISEEDWEQAEELLQQSVTMATEKLALMTQIRDALASMDT